MTQFRFSPAALACVLLLAACQSQDRDSEADEEEAPPIPVEISLPTRGDVYAVYSGTAPIEAFAEADVIAKVDGEIRTILAEEGDEVRKGQVLARLDGDRLRLELRESEAKLGKLQRDYERNLDLKGKGLISEGDFEKIKFEMDALQASFNLAKLELDYTQIRAPIGGVIAERYIRLGNTIRVGDPVFRVTSLDPLVVYLHVPEREYRNIDSGQVVTIEVDALQGETIIASVTRVSPIVDPETGTFKITIEIADKERRIKPGMFGRISVVYDKHENALQLPRSALVEDAGQTSVFVVEDDVAIKKVVQTGFSDRGMIEIVAGLVDGENVVTVGQLGLKPDAKVTVVNRPQSTDAVADETDEDAGQQVTENATTD
ncbi:MAG: efflux RND transporter periplasmic adaptor subunit [Proteobacteria bacterium]|nr:efflux RND transporter periplasmic adaptor subunit [Pseudomonadota bacterium]